jgi:hypothetical protein
MINTIKSALNKRSHRKLMQEAEEAALSGDPRAYYDHKLDRMVRTAAITTGAAVVASLIVGFAGAVLEKAAELDEEN